MSGERDRERGRGEGRRGTQKVGIDRQIEGKREKQREGSEKRDRERYIIIIHLVARTSHQ